ncbi:hypothetical protein ROS217_02125 [Roseovarius sp. 217]|nr:hypothetical protein ROS217_02125 [Roseovarius sp. 217]
MDVRIIIETTFDNGEKRIHQLDGISRPYRVTCPEGFGLRLEDGKRIVEQIQRAILCDQVEEISRERRVCLKNLDEPQLPSRCRVSTQVVVCLFFKEGRNAPIRT